MGVRVTKTRNKDGSITKRTTISRKTILGTTKTESFVERIPAKKAGCFSGCCVYAIGILSIVILTSAFVCSLLF